MSATAKTCVRCKQKDITEFSSCRFCGTKYGAVLEKAACPRQDFGSMLRSTPTLIIILLLCSMLKGPFFWMVAYFMSGGQTPNQIISSQLHPRSR